MEKIRLACLFCDRDDCDGIDAIPETWFSVDEVQSYKASIREATGEDVLDWYTHLGVCPECQQTELRLTEQSA